MKNTINKWEAKEHYEFFYSLPKGIGNKAFLLFKFDGVENFKNSYTVISNMIKSVETEAYQEFEKERFEIIRKYAVKDEFGRIVPTDGEVEIVDGKMEEVKIVMATLNEKYKDAILEYDTNFNEIWEVAHKEEVEVDIPMISFDDVPEGLSETEMNYIFKYFLKR